MADSYLSDIDMNVDIAPHSSSSPLKRKGSPALTESSELSALSDGEELVLKVEPKKRKLCEEALPTPKKSGPVELNGAKLVFKQKPSYTASLLQTTQELVEFQVYLKNVTATLTAFEDKHIGLVVKLAHESEKTSKNLAKAIKEKLGASELILPSLIETLIEAHLTRNNYGFTSSDLSNDPKAKGLTIFRWEAKDASTHLPAEELDNINARAEERRKAREGVEAIAAKLSWAEKVKLLGGEKVTKPAAKVAAPKPLPKPKAVVAGPSTEASSSSPTKKEKKEKVETEEQKQVRLEKEAKAIQKKAEQEAKKAEQEEKAAKRKAEADKKAAEVEAKKAQEDKVKAVVQKQANMMNMFVKKPAQPKRAVLTTSALPTVSDFEGAFLPFVMRKNLTLAPLNPVKEKWEKNVSKAAGKMDVDWESASPEVLLKDFLSHIPKISLPRSYQFANRIKSGPAASSVREVIQASVEAEISGNGDPHRIKEQFKNLKLYPRKLLQFHEDARPPMNGTWTRSSNCVGPRTPFAQDIAFDYSYDSASDWEDDEEGEDVFDGVVAKAEAGEGDMWDTDEDDGSFRGGDESDDGWMVDEDEEDAENGGPVAIDVDAPKVASPVKLTDKLRLEKAAKKKKNAFKPLVPFIRGPLWEEPLGTSAWDGFDSYRIQFLNDTPVGVDPFSYVTPVKAAVEKKSAVPTSPSMFKIPALPQHMKSNAVASSSSPGGSSSVADGPPSSSPLAPKNAVKIPKEKAPPKVPFPQKLMADFLDIVTKSTKTKKVLEVQLQERFGKEATLAAIKYRLEEVAKRCGNKEGDGWALTPVGLSWSASVGAAH